MTARAPITGIGLGLRWDFLDEVVDAIEAQRRLPNVDFFEISPENYMRREGYIPETLARVRAAYPILTHSLTLGFGRLTPFDPGFVAELDAFVAPLGPAFHSDHLCVSSAGNRYVHDLLPLPWSRAAVARTSQRIREARDGLRVPIAVENISRYLTLGVPEMEEVDFLREVLDRSQAKLLLDVNNVVVNAKNDEVFGEDGYVDRARAFLDAVPLEAVVQIHVAGHERSEPDGLTIDTHGAPVEDAVYGLLEHVIASTGPVPVVLERDHKVPPLDVLLAELGALRAAYDRGLAARARSGGAP